MIGIENSALPKSDDVRSVIIRLGKIVLSFIFIVLEIIRLSVCTYISGVVLGRHGGFISQLYLFFRFGLGICMGTGTQFFPWIHVDDVCRIVLFAIENNELKGIVNGVAPDVRVKYTHFL